MYSDFLKAVGENNVPLTDAIITYEYKNGHYHVLVPHPETGKTPLMHAIEKSNLEVADLLLAWADPRIRYE